VIAAVTFDFWETLVHDTPENLERGRLMRLGSTARILAAAGMEQPMAAIEAAYERSGAEMRERFWSVRRDAPIGEQVRLFLDCIAAGLADRLSRDVVAAAVEAYASPVLHLPPVLNAGAAEAVRRLAGWGVRLGIVSNTGRTPGMVLRRVLERHGVLAYFSAISYSDEVGVRKPDAKIFELTLGRLGVAAGRALHVGDNPHDDVLGAKGCGMSAAHYAANGASPSPDADVVVADLAELPRALGVPQA
jgi:putative hydrolase of the HAD superfamily